MSMLYYATPDTGGETRKWSTHFNPRWRPIFYFVISNCRLEHRHTHIFVQFRVRTIGSMQFSWFETDAKPTVFITANIKFPHLFCFRKMLFYNSCSKLATLFILYTLAALYLLLQSPPAPPAPHLPHENKYPSDTLLRNPSISNTPTYCCTLYTVKKLSVAVCGGIPAVLHLTHIDTQSTFFVDAYSNDRERL